MGGVPPIHGQFNVAKKHMVNQWFFWDLNDFQTHLEDREIEDDLSRFKP
jgi:hypothetical protein